jgi:geranylgeranyl diphosphate synthase type II
MSGDSPKRRYNELRRMVDRRLSALVRRSGSHDVRMALKDVLNAGGKRVRSVLLLLSCQAVGGDVRMAIHAAAGVELMHNFTLVHDDIMDNAPMRRGRPSVHTRWGLSHGVLVGDILLALAYSCVQQTKGSKTERLLRLFTQGFLAVCEGQGKDMEFERKNDVRLPDYYRMIEKKTSALLSMAAAMGGVVGNGKEGHVEALRRFGQHLGRAFQIQDDLLDVVANETEFGKPVGGDILEGKKTFLLLKAVEEAGRQDRAALAKVMRRGNRSGGSRRNTGIVRRIAALYEKLGVTEAAREEVHRATRQATRALASLPDNDGTAMLHWLSGMLLRRES